MSRLVKAPRKKIHDALVEMGFGYDPKYKYYHAFLDNSPITLSLYFDKVDDKYEVSLWAYYPQKVGHSGYGMNPDGLIALKPYGKLLHGIDFAVEAEKECWSIEQLLETAKLCELIRYWARVITDPKIMITLSDYLLGLSDECPDEFSDVDTTYSGRKIIPARLWSKALYLAFSSDYEKCEQTMLEREVDEKILDDCKNKRIFVSPDLVSFMNKIGARGLDI